MNGTQRLASPAEDLHAAASVSTQAWSVAGEPCALIPLGMAAHGVAVSVMTEPPGFSIR